jgi:hypothetical protein
MPIAEPDKDGAHTESVGTGPGLNANVNHC